MNKTGIQSGRLYDDDNFLEGMLIIKNAGFDCIDFNIDTKMDYCDVCSGQVNEFFAQSDDALKAYYQPQKDALSELGLSFSQMHGPFPVYAEGKEEANRQFINATEKCLMLCEFFGCPYLVVHPTMGKDRKNEKEINMDFYKALIPAAEKHGVGICLENMFARNRRQIYEAVCSDIYQAVEFIDELNGYAGKRIFSFCYDLGHATLLGKDIRRSINLLGDRLTVLHIHDNNGMDDLHLQPYSCAEGGYYTNWEAFLDGLRDIDFKGVLSFETFNSLTDLPKELHPAMVNYIGCVGKYFAQQLSRQQN